MVESVSISRSGLIRSRLYSLALHELLVVSWVLMETALLGPLLLVFLPWARFWPPLLFTFWLSLLILASFNLARLLAWLRLPVDRQRIVTAVALALAVLLNLRLLLYEGYDPFELGWLGAFFSHVGRFDNPLWLRDMAVFGAAILAWWRGIAVSGRRVDIGELGLRFRLGVFVAAPVAIVLATLRLTRPVTPFVLAYFLAALTAIVLTRLEMLELDERTPEGPMRPVTLLTIALTAMLAVTLTALVAGILGGNPVGNLTAALKPLWTALAFLVVSVLAIVSQLSLPLVAGLSSFFDWLVDLLGEGFGQIAEILNLPELPGALVLVPEDVVEDTAARSPLSGQLLGTLGMLAIVLLVSLALSGAWVLARRRAGGEDRQSTLPESGRAGLDLDGLAQQVLNRLPFLRGWRAAASIRHIYRAMSETAAGGGYGRLPSETPSEYLATLSLAWPNHAAETGLITAAYLRVRYGEIPEQKRELEAIKSAWKRLQDTPLQDAAGTAPETVDIKHKQ